MTAISKYLGTQDSPGHKLSWPGMHGLPVRGNNGNLLRDDELDEFFEVTFDFYAKEFDMTNEEQAAEYTQIMDRVVNGWYRREFVDRHRDETGKLRIYLEWSQTYGQINPRAATRVSDGSNVSRTSAKAG